MYNDVYYIRMGITVKCVTNKLKTKQEYNIRCVHISVFVYIKCTGVRTHTVVHIFTYV